MAKKKCRMVSLDTSSTCSGYACWENGKLIECGTLDHRKEKDAEIRVEDMCLDIVNTLNRFLPTIVVIELTAVTKNAQTQRMLSEIVGVVRGWSLVKYAEFVRLRPAEWRSLVKGEEPCPVKRADAKRWAIKRVKEVFLLDVPEDCAEAILIGQARVNQFKNWGG